MRDAFDSVRQRHEFWLLLIVVMLVIFLSILNPSFFTLRNLIDLLTTNAYLGILCSGLLVVVIAGGIDISFTATASVAQYIALTYVNAAGGNWAIVLLVACGIGIICGLINAVLIYKFGIKSIIASIATLNVFYGLLITYSGGQYIYTLPDWFQNGFNLFEITNDDGSFDLVNLQIALLVFSFLLTWLLLGRSSTGRQIFAMGGNPEAARRVGFGMYRLHLIVYGYMGFTAGLASIAQAQLAMSVLPNALVGKELDVLAAVVLGGASLVGGVGTVFGTFLGIALLAIMKNGLLLIGVSSFWFQFFTGLVIVVAVSTTAVQMRRGAGRKWSMS